MSGLRLRVCSGVQIVARVASDWVEEHARGSSGFGFAVGRSVEDTYRELAARKADLGGVRGFTIDELHPMDPSDERTFAARLDALLGSSDLTVERFDPRAGDPDREAARIDALAAQIGLSGCVLGLGPNGHLAFNEPGEPFGAPPRFVRFLPETLAHLGGADAVAPAKGGMTMSLRTILSADALLLVVGGQKQDAFERLIWGPLTMDLPASILRLHPDVTILTSREQAEERLDELLELPRIETVDG